MIKKVLGILALAAIMLSCGNMKQKKDANSDQVAVLTVDQVMENIQSYVDSTIVIEGTVNHVCKHGGKRMFIMGENPDVAIKIIPNEKIGMFEKELEGSFVIVTGVVTELKIDEAYVSKLENETEEEVKGEAMHDHSGGTHDEEAENESKAQFEAMRAQITESGKGYYSQYWIEAVTLEVKDVENAEGEEHVHIEGDDHEHDEVEEHEHAEGEEHSH